MSVGEFQLRLSAGEYKSFTDTNGVEMVVVTPGLPFELAGSHWERGWTCVAKNDPQKTPRTFWLKDGKWISVGAAAAAVAEIKRNVAARPAAAAAAVDAKEDVEEEEE